MKQKKILVIFIVPLLLFSCLEERIEKDGTQYMRFLCDDDGYHVAVIKSDEMKKLVFNGIYSLYNDQDERYAAIECTDSILQMKQYYVTELIDNSLNSAYGLIFDGSLLLETEYDEITLMSSRVIHAKKENLHSYYYTGKKIFETYSPDVSISVYLKSNVCYDYKVFEVKDDEQNHYYTYTDSIVKGPFIDVLHDSELIKAVLPNGEKIIFNCHGKEFSEFEKPTGFDNIYIRYNQKDPSRFTFVYKTQVKSPTGGSLRQETELIDFDYYEYLQSEHAITYSSKTEAGIIYKDGLHKIFKHRDQHIVIVKHLSPHRFVVSLNAHEARPLYGVMNPKGKFILEPNFDEISLSEDHEDEIKCSKIDKFGEKIGRYDIETGELKELYRQKSIPREGVSSMKSGRITNLLRKRVTGFFYSFYSIFFEEIMHSTHIYGHLIKNIYKVFVNINTNKKYKNELQN